MGFLKAFLGLMVTIIVMAVFIPVTTELLPTMINDMGAATGMMISSMVLIIIACAIFIFIRQSMSRNENADIGQI